MSRRNRTWPAGTPCWADLTTTDPVGAQAFYAAVLGWEYELRGPGGAYALASLGGAAAAAITHPEVGPPGWTPYLAVDDAAATARAVTAAGGAVLSGPDDVPPGRGRSLLFTDPAGVLTGAWEAASFIGCEVVNEPGALVWEDARSPDPDASRAFLTAVFGHRHESFDEAPEGYTTIAHDVPFPLGGVGPLFGASGPSWVVYFQVADVDAALVTALRLGGSAPRPPDDTPFGRIAELTDPSGLPFAPLQNTGQSDPDRS